MYNVLDKDMTETEIPSFLVGITEYREHGGECQGRNKQKTINALCLTDMESPPLAM